MLHLFSAACYHYVTIVCLSCLCWLRNMSDLRLPPCSIRWLLSLFHFFIVDCYYCRFHHFLQHQHLTKHSAGQHAMPALAAEHVGPEPFPLQHQVNTCFVFQVFIMECYYCGVSSSLLCVILLSIFYSSSIQLCSLRVSQSCRSFERCLFPPPPPIQPAADVKWKRRHFKSVPAWELQHCL